VPGKAVPLENAVVKSNIIETTTVTKPTLLATDRLKSVPKKGQGTEDEEAQVLGR